MVRVLGHMHAAVPAQNTFGAGFSLRLRRACRASDAGAGASGEPLFAGPRDLRATLRKHMVAMSEEDKLTEVLGAKRPRSSQVGREADISALTHTRSTAQRAQDLEGMDAVLKYMVRHCSLACFVQAPCSQCLRAWQRR